MKATVFQGCHKLHQRIIHNVFGKKWLCNGLNSMLMTVGQDGRIVFMVKADRPGYKLSIFTDLVHFAA